MTAPTATIPQQGFAIECRGLVKTYRGGVQAVRGLDLAVREGECFGLLGPNGAGKTTTIEILEGMLEPSAGEVRLLGRAWSDAEGYLRERIGISLQETRLSEKLTVRETIRLFRSFYRTGIEPEEGVALVSLEEKAEARVGKLSGGQKQRLALACALVGNPALLFLDEPSTGLDPQSRRQVWEVLTRFRRQGRTILLTTHAMDEAERLCDRVAIVDHGKVIALGTPAELIASLGGEHFIELSLGEEEVGARVEPRELANLPGVRNVQLEGNLIRLEVPAPHVTLPALLETLGPRAGNLTSLSIRNASLEDVFVKLTGRHLRDGEK